MFQPSEGEPWLSKTKMCEFLFICICIPIVWQSALLPCLFVAKAHEQTLSAETVTGQITVIHLEDALKCTKCI